jgi:hypothetical protein
MPWYLRLQEAVLESNSLLLVSHAQIGFNSARSNLFAHSGSRTGPQDGSGHVCDNGSAGGVFAQNNGVHDTDGLQMDLPISGTAGFTPFVEFEFRNEEDLFFPSLVNHRAEDWLQDIFGSNISV